MKGRIPEYRVSRTSRLYCNYPYLATIVQINEIKDTRAQIVQFCSNLIFKSVDTVDTLDNVICRQCVFLATGKIHICQPTFDTFQVVHFPVFNNQIRKLDNVVVH